MEEKAVVPSRGFPRDSRGIRVLAMVLVGKLIRGGGPPEKVKLGVIGMSHRRIDERYICRQPSDKNELSSMVLLKLNAEYRP